MEMLLVSEVGQRGKADTLSVLASFLKHFRVIVYTWLAMEYCIIILDLKTIFSAVATQTKDRVQAQQIVSYIFKLCNLIKE